MPENLLQPVVRWLWLLVVFATVAVAISLEKFECRSNDAYPYEGTVLSIDAAKERVRLKHHYISGVSTTQTTFAVDTQYVNLQDGIEVGDEVSFRLNTYDGESVITGLKKR